MSFESQSLKKMSLVIAFVSILLLAILYLTYSLSNGNISRVLTTDILKLDEDAYGDTSFDSSNLKFSPILDKNVKSDSNHVIYIKFNVGGSKDNNKDNIIYDISLADLKIDCELLSPYIQWKLFKNGKVISVGNLDYKFDTIVNNRLVLTNIQQDLVKYSDDKSVYDHYEFYMWFSDSCQDDNIFNCEGATDQSKLLNKNLSGKVEVELYGDGKKELERHPSLKLDDSMCNIN